MCGIVPSCISIFSFRCKSILQIVARAASVAATNAASVLVALIRQHAGNFHNNLPKKIIWVVNAFNNMQIPLCSNSALGLLILFMEESSIRINPYAFVLLLGLIIFPARSFFFRPVPHAGKCYCGHRWSKINLVQQVLGSPSVHPDNDVHGVGQDLNMNLILPARVPFPELVSFLLLPPFVSFSYLDNFLQPFSSSNIVSRPLHLCIKLSLWRMTLLSSSFSSRWHALIISSVQRSLFCPSTCS